MNGKHTPGPWSVGDAPDSRVAVYGGNTCVAVVGEQGYPVVDADAALISAAPDMLEACREAMALLGNPDADSTDADRVERVLWAAIRKATGEPVAKRYRYATDAASGTIEAASLAAAFNSLRSKITDAQRDDGATLWVEDPETGARIVMGQEGGAR